MNLKHIHTRKRSDGLKETVLEIPAAEMMDKIRRMNKECGEICGGPIEAIIVLTQLLDIYKEHTGTSTAMIVENRPQ